MNKTNTEMIDETFWDNYNANYENPNNCLNEFPNDCVAYDDFVASKGYESWEEYYEFDPVF